MSRTRCNAGEWSQVRRLVPDSHSEETFGASLALDGDLLAVGSASYADRATERGSVYIYQRDRGGADQWGRVTRLAAPTDSNLGPADGFGGSLLLRGNTMIVSAFAEDQTGEDSGAVYVYEKRIGPRRWSLVQKLKAPDAAAAAGTFFGSSLAMDGNILAIGAPAHFGQTNGPGAVYVFERGAGPASWRLTARIPAPQLSRGRFGSQVAISGQTLAVLAQAQGAVFFYQRNPSGGGWTGIGRFTRHGASSVGSTFHGSDPESDFGRAFVLDPLP